MHPRRQRNEQLQATARYQARGTRLCRSFFRFGRYRRSGGAHFGLRRSACLTPFFSPTIDLCCTSCDPLDFPRVVTQEKKTRKKDPLVNSPITNPPLSFGMEVVSTVVLYKFIRPRHLLSIVPEISWYVPKIDDFTLFAHTNWLVHWYTGTVPVPYQVQHPYRREYTVYSRRMVHPGLDVTNV